MESGEQREDVHQHDGVSDERNDKYCRSDCPECIFKPHMIEYIAVKCQGDSKSQEDQPDLGSLSEIFLK